MPGIAPTFRTILSPALILLCLIWPPANGVCRQAAAQLHDIRFGDHPDFTRLVFDVQGNRPVRVGPAAEEMIEIDYQQTETKVKPAGLPVRSFRFVSGIRFQQTNGTLRIVISYKRNTSVNYFFLDSDPPRPGWHRLVMDFSRGTPQKPDSPGPAPEQADKKPQEKPAPAPAVNQAKVQPATAANAAKTPSKAAPQSAPARSAALPAPTVPDNPFQIADKSFSQYRGDSPEQALQFLRQYEDAIASNPNAPEVPLALYRCALAHIALKDRAKAERSLQKVIASYPGHPTVPLCWLRLGELLLERNSYLEAIGALRSALTFPLEQTEAVAARYQLGKALTAVSAYDEAVTNFEKCLTDDPQVYLKQPDLLKLLGESLFAGKRYQESCRYLTWYFNLQPDAPGRDLVLARVAEALQRQGESVLAEKLYGYLERKFPDTEGYIISQIRKAEAMEKQNGEVAHMFYERLSKYSLPVPLRKLVFYKLASWEWEHQHYKECLAIIDSLLQGRANAAEYDEFVVLRQKVILDWAMQSFNNKDYIKVIQLYREHLPLFQSQGSEDLHAAVAESYGQLKLYPEAVKHYQTLLATKSPKKEEWLLKSAQYAYLYGDLDSAEKSLAQMPESALELEKTQLQIEIDFAKGNYQHVARQFEKLAKAGDSLNQIDLPILLHYAESLIKLKRQKDALACLEKVTSRLAKDDTEQRVRVCLLQNECYQTLNQPENAVAALEGAIALTPSDELKNQLNYQLSQLYAKTGQLDKATEKLTRLLESPQPFWKTVAQQELNHLQLRGVTSKSTF